jgi:hypothetical protein
MKNTKKPMRSGNGFKGGTQAPPSGRVPQRKEHE